MVKQRTPGHSKSRIAMLALKPKWMPMWLHTLLNRRKPIPEGTLVRVRAEHADSLDRDMCTDHGMLWIVQGEDKGLPDTYFAKSLATGAVWLWFDYQMEQADD